jgi:hypothetical protein
MKQDFIKLQKGILLSIFKALARSFYGSLLLVCWLVGCWEKGWTNVEIETGNEY